MSDQARARKKTDAKSVPIPITVLCVAALVAFMVWWGIKSFGPEPELITEAGKKNNAWLDKIARESQGDFSKLAPEDQGLLQKQNFGHGVEAIKARYKDLGGK